jgi:hypothetical protein
MDEPWKYHDKEINQAQKDKYYMILLIWNA